MIHRTWWDGVEEPRLTYGWHIVRDIKEIEWVDLGLRVLIAECLMHDPNEAPER